jgi:hypothetical protein
MENTQAAFKSLKEAITGNAILAYPVLGKEGWLVHTYALERAMGAMLSHLQAGIEKVI